MTVNNRRQLSACHPPGNRSVSRHRGRARGLSIVELMVGITIGLFILAGATLVMTSQTSDNRLLLLETQVQQDMRALAHFITRDIRRANYYGGAFRQVWSTDPALATFNPYSQLDPPSSNGSPTITYARSLDDRLIQAAPGDDVVSESELVTIALNTSTHAVEMTLGNAVQALTDANVLRVTDLTFRVSFKDIPVPCAAQCPVNPANCRLNQRQRTVTFSIVGEAVHDPRVRRSIQETVRLRNDINLYVC